MKKHLQAILLCAALAHGPSHAAEPGNFSFGVIAHPADASAGDETLRRAIEEADAQELAFVVANGIKAADEPCTDRLYLRRQALLQDAKSGVIVTVAASDWTDCKNPNGKSAAIGKLNRLREIFFGDEFSPGAGKATVIRQSMTAKYRSFVENARWETGRLMFATINIPANNNHYVFDAGRNSEFEDRLVANRDWLNRIFTSAARKKYMGVVLFCDGNPLAESDAPAAKRDGYAETRRQLKTLAAKFPGKVLIVHGGNTVPGGSPRISWQDNLGELNAGSGWTKITVQRSDPALFTIAGRAADNE